MTKHIRFSPPRILVHASAGEGETSGLYRLAAPAEALRRSGYAATIVNRHLPTPEVMKALKPDTVVIQHFNTDIGIAAAKVYRQQKDLHIVFEIDDLLWAIDETNPNKKAFAPDILQRLKKVISMADSAVVSTPVLADHVHKSLGVPHSSIKIVRNNLPQAFVTAALAARDNRPARTSPKPRVGWAGGISHAGDLALLTDIVNGTSDYIQWVFLGALPGGVSQANVEFHPPVPYSHYPTKLAMLDLDIAVAPLADTLFNSCKSDLRILEFAACGYPIIASDCPAFSDVPDSVVKVKNPEDWLSAISDLLNNPEVGELAQTTHDWVKTNRLLESQANIERWAWAWTADTSDIFRPSLAPATGGTPVIVGEPVSFEDAPTYYSVRQARVEHPNSPIICIRPGCVPTTEQIAFLIDSSTKGNFLSACTLTNDGDYPAPGRFIQLSGKVAENMAEAALNLAGNDATPIQIGYSSGPLVYLSAAALNAVGIPDEERYEGDLDAAIIDWCMRCQDIGGYNHAAIPNLFVPVHGPGRTSADQSFAKAAIGEITTWHPSFQVIRDKLSGNDLFAEVRKNLDISYANISYEAPGCADYAEWSAIYDHVTPECVRWAERVTDSVKENPVVIGIVMPVYNTPPELLVAAAESVKAQLYPCWHLIIVDDCSTSEDTRQALSAIDGTDKRITIIHCPENNHISGATNIGLSYCRGLSSCNAEWVTFLDHDDTLAPFALTAIVEAINAKPYVNLIYSDSDMIDTTGKLHSPYFKPDFDYDLLLGQNYVCHLTAYRADFLADINGFKSEFDGSQDYDAVLRYIEYACWRDGKPDRNVIHHIPQVLYHWRQAPDSVASNLANKPYALEAAHKAVLSHLKRIGLQAFIGPQPRAPIHHLVRFLVSDPQPKTSIIILTQVNRQRLEKCLTSIFKHTVYTNYEVIVRQIGEDPGITHTLRVYAKKFSNLKVANSKGLAGAFNFALLNNTVVEKHVSPDTQVVVFLNDDTEIIEPTWLNDMVATALRADVGAVGVKTIYPNGLVQHNGITVNDMAPAGEYAIHMHQGMSNADPGLHAGAVLAHQAIAVTAACMAVRKSVFTDIGGFDAVKFPLDYNDVDLCFRLYNAGYSNVVLSYLLVVHAEGGTKRENPMQVNRSGMLASETAVRSTVSHDPYANPNKAHHFSGAAVETFPARPWLTTLYRPRTILVGGDKKDTHNLFVAGELAIRAEADGPFLRLSEPTCEHGGVIDCRDYGTFTTLLGKLQVQRIIVRRLGNGSADAILGAIVHAFHMGDVRLDYWPANFESVCPRLDCINSEGACGHKWKDDVAGCQTCIDRDGSPYGFVNIHAWRLAWSRFGEAVKASNDAEDQKVQTESKE